MPKPSQCPPGTDGDEGAGYHHHPPPAVYAQSSFEGFLGFPHGHSSSKEQSDGLGHDDRRVECDHDGQPDLDGLVGHPQTHFVELTLRDSVSARSFLSSRDDLPSFPPTIFTAPDARAKSMLEPFVRSCGLGDRRRADARAAPHGRAGRPGTGSS